jgi:hypothetical protein
MATVYCVTEGPGMPVKIGTATNLKARMSQIQSATWRPVLLCWTAPGYRPHEAALKAALKPKRMGGEWYYDDDDAVKMILQMAASEAQLILAAERLATKNLPVLDEPSVKPARVYGRPVMPFKARAA